MERPFVNVEVQLTDVECYSGKVESREALCFSQWDTGTVGTYCRLPLPYDKLL